MTAAEALEGRLDARGVYAETRALLRSAGVEFAEAAPTGRRVSPLVSRARWRCWALLRGYGWSLPEIGRAWGVSHTSVAYGRRQLRSASKKVDGVSEARHCSGRGWARCS